MDVHLMLYIRLAYAVLIVLFLFCGLLRRCNLWACYGGDADRLFPARKVVMATYFSSLLLLPCLLHPQSHDARLLARCFWILWIPAVSTLSLLRFPPGRHGRLRMAVVGAAPTAAISVLSAVALCGSDLLAPVRSAVVLAAGALSVALSAGLLHVTLQAWGLIFNGKGGSEPAPAVFPRHFAMGTLWLPVLALAAAWAVFLTDSPAANAALTSWIAVSGAGILLVIMHPQPAVAEVATVSVKASTAAEGAAATVEEDAPTAEGDRQEEEECRLSQQLVDRIERQVREVVEKNRMYLDPDMSKSKLLSRLDTNSMYLHIVLKHRFGSFNSYINGLRLDYAMQYQDEHPDAKHEEVAMKCGFGSVRTFYRARKNYGETQKNKAKTE